jgi:hypothetical protein
MAAPERLAPSTLTRKISFLRANVWCVERTGHLYGDSVEGVYGPFTRQEAAYEFERWATKNNPFYATTYNVRRIEPVDDLVTQMQAMTKEKLKWRPTT